MWTQLQGFERRGRTCRGALSRSALWGCPSAGQEPCLNSAPWGHRATGLPRLCRADHPIRPRKEGLALGFSVCRYILLFTYLIFGCAEPSLLQGLSSSSRKRGLLSSCGAVSFCPSWVLGVWTSAVAARGSVLAGPQLWSRGLVVLRHVGSSWTRNGARVSCIGRRTLYHGATRGVPWHCGFKVHPGEVTRSFPERQRAEGERAPDRR